MHLPIKIFEIKYYYTFRINFYSRDGENTKVKELFGINKFLKIAIFNESEKKKVNATIRTEKFFKDDDILQIISDNPFIISVERVEE